MMMMITIMVKLMDCYRPADIYGGNGASWEAVPVSEKPLVEKLEKLNSI